MNLRKFVLTLAQVLLLSTAISLAQTGGGGGGGGGGAGIPGPTGTGQCFISTASGAGNWIWGSCSGSSNLSFSSLTTGTNTAATLTLGSGSTLNSLAGSTVNFSATAVANFKVPVAAGLVTSANGNIGFDSTALNWHIWGNAVDNYILVSPVSGTFNANDCVKIGSGAPGVVTLVDSGAGCGGGNVNNSGTPLSNQIAQFTDATHIQGLATTGSGNAVLATSPTLVTPTIGVATATSINKVAITAPAASATLTIANTKTLTASNTLTLTGTDGSSVAFGTGGTVAYTANNLSVFAATTSAQLAGVLSDELGSGLAVFATALQGTDANLLTAGSVSGTGVVLCTDANGGATTAGCTVGGGNVSNSGTPTNGQIAQFINATQIQGIATTGSGSAVLATSPTLVTPNVGVATATSVNKVLISTPATNATLTIADSKTLTVSNTVTLSGTDGSTIAFGGGGTVAYTANNLSVFAATTSAQLAGVISDETGTGLLVFGTTPTLTTPVLGVATATSINKVAITAPAASATLTIANTKTATISNTLTFTGTDASSIAFGTGGTVTYTSNNLSVFAATTSAQLAGVISDEIGSGKSVFATALQGTDVNLLTSGTVSGTAATLCTDANGGATTVGCTSGGNTTSTTLTTNLIPKANGANSIINSSITDDGTTVTIADTGGLAISSSVAASVALGQGTAATTSTNAVSLAGPTTVPTAYNIVYPSAAATGYMKISTSTSQTGCTASSTNDCMAIEANIDLTADVGATKLPIANGGTNAATAAAALINLFPTATRAGDVIYCATFSTGACTSWALLAGNNSGTNFLSENSSGAPSWAAGSTSVALSAINAATGTNTIANGDNAQVWDWALTTSGKSAFTFGETTAATSAGTPYLVNIQTLATSTANPLVVTAVGTANGVQVLKTGFLSTKGTGGTDSNMLFCDVTASTKCAQLVLSNITAANTRTVNIPDANSTTAQTQAGSSHNFITAMSAQGVFSIAQPAIADLSDGANIITDSGSGTTHGVAIFSGAKTLTSTGAGSTGHPLLSGGASADPSFGQAIVIGVAGSSVGSVQFNNATSGSITLQPDVGALGTVTATLPANTGTIAELNLAQSWTAVQTFSTAAVLGSSTATTQSAGDNSTKVATTAYADAAGSGGKITGLSGLTTGNVYYNIGGTLTPANAYGIPSAITVGFTNGSANITSVGNTLIVGAAVQFQTTSALPTNFSTSTTYYVVSAGSPFTVSATYGGGAISAGSAGAGTQTLTIVPTLVTNPAYCVASSATVCVFSGPITTGSWTAGQALYVSDATSGALTQTNPASGAGSSGHFVQRIGVATSTTAILVNVSPDVATVQ